MIILAIILVVLIVFYLNNTSIFNYWEKRGIKHDKPMFIFGNNARNYLMQKSVTEIAVEMYWKYPNESLVGFFRSTRPELIIRDPEIIKHILITDFTQFHSRGLIVDQNSIEPILRNLFFAEGDLWRLLRQCMTPAFTSGKLKASFPLIVERAKRLQDQTLYAATQRTTIDARDLMARYTIDFIGAYGFGIDIDTLSDKESEFRKLGTKIFKVDCKRFIMRTLKQFMPKLFGFLKPLDDVEKSMNHLVSMILQEKNYEPSNNNDFIDLLLECKKKGTMIADSIERVKPDGTPEIVTLEMDLNVMVAQVFIFFAAGFETSSSATSFTLHLLAHHPEVQKKVQADIDTVLAKYDNQLNYDAVNEMTYLNWTYKEGLRIFPSGGIFMRECVRKYKIPHTDVTIDKGVCIVVPVQAMHMDPLYFEKPEEFRPERFSPEEFGVTQKNVYLPFGAGPRACIGERLAVMQSLAGLAAILSKFTVEPAPETTRHLTVEPKSGIVQTIKGGVPLQFKKRMSV